MAESSLELHNTRPPHKPIQLQSEWWRLVLTPEAVADGVDVLLLGRGEDPASTVRYWEECRRGKRLVLVWHPRNQRRVAAKLFEDLTGKIAMACWTDGWAVYTFPRAFYGTIYKRGDDAAD